MKLKFALLCATLIGACAAGTPAFAADPVAEANCTVSGLVQGGGGLDGQNLNGPLNLSLATWKIGFAEGALAYECGSWGAQLDGAFYGHWANSTYRGTNYDMSNPEGHIGGAAYWRNADVGQFGLAASRVFQSNAIRLGGVAPIPDTSSGLWRIGGFGEYFAGDMFTLGAGAHYISGQQIYPLGGFQFEHQGIEAEIYAKAYASDNLALSVRGDVLASKFTFSGAPVTNWNGFAIGAEAEYLVPDTALSLFASARYAKRTWDFGSGYNFDDAQGLLGVKFAFGGSAPSSLRNRDRHGAYDNTSVFDEKLPNYSSSLLSAVVAAGGAGGGD
jgi:hypothetical protein